MTNYSQIDTAFLIPQDEESIDRLQRFYEQIKWEVFRNDKPGTPTLVGPKNPDSDVTPTIGYRQTDDPNKLGRFIINKAAEPTTFARGLRLPDLMGLVQVTLILPTDNDVYDQYENGRGVLKAHAKSRPVKQENGVYFSFSDPFNYEINIASNNTTEARTTKEGSPSKYLAVFLDPDTNSAVRIINKESLTQFEWDTRSQNRQGSKTYSSIARSAHLPRPDQLGRGHARVGSLSDFFFHDKNGQPLGILASKIDAMIDFIDETKIKIPNLGTDSRNLLKALAKELSQKNTD